MKCRLLQDCKGPNPEFVVADADAAVRRGETYPIARDRVLPKGTEIEDRDCWRLCVPQAFNMPALAEPADDECREKVERFMGQRPARLAMVQQAVAAAEKGRTTDKRGKRHAKALAEAYGDELKGQANGVAGQEG